jgi:hypothetical protein
MLRKLTTTDPRRGIGQVVESAKAGWCPRPVVQELLSLSISLIFVLMRRL